MARLKKAQKGYGIGSPLITLAPRAILAQRAPTSRDTAQIGQDWIDIPNNAIYTLVSIVAGAATWATASSSGATTLASLLVNPGSAVIQAGNLDITAGDLSVGGNTTLTGDLTVGGVTQINGDLNLNSAQLIDLVSTSNTDPAILLRTNGGTTETIQLINSQGTAADAIELTSTVGGLDFNAAGLIAITSTRNNAQAILLESTVGGIDILASGAGAGEDIDIIATGSSVNITSTENAADAIVINASNGTSGGVIIDSGPSGITMAPSGDAVIVSIADVAPAGARTLTLGGGTLVGAFADTIDIGADGVNNAGGSKIVNIASGALTTGTQTVNINSGNAAAGTHTINLSTGTGTKAVNVGNADGLTTVNIDGITLINDDINVNTSINTGTSTGTVSIGNAAAGAITLDTAANISLDSATASNFTVTGAGADLTLNSAGGSVNITATEDVADAIKLDATGGTDSAVEVETADDDGIVFRMISANGSAELIIGVADPNAAVTASQGSLFIDKTNADLYINTNGATAWTAFQK